MTEYEAIREKAANQKRDVEKALTKFMAKTGKKSLTHSLFPDEELANLFPLIELEVQSNVYIEALLAKDQVFEDDDENQQKVEESKKKTPKVAENGASASGGGDQAKDDSIANKSDPANDSDVLDNPYLREPKNYSTSS